MSEETISLELTPRDLLGKKVKHLRKEGQIPAVIHNHGKDSIIVVADEKSLLKVYKAAGKHHPVEVKVGSKNYTTLIKSADFEPKKHRITHVVFNAVDKNQKVEAEIPVHAKYQEGSDSYPAEKAGLLVISNLDSVNVEALPADLPDVIYYDAAKLAELGDHVTIADLIVPANVILKEDENQTIASVFEPSAVAAANDALAGAEEEVSVEETSEEANVEAKEEE